MHKILIAPTAYKGTFGPVRVAEAIAEGARQSGLDVECTIMPLADGGDGTLECLHATLGGKLELLSVMGPLHGAAEAKCLRFRGTAVIELASASGLALMGDKLSPLQAHTAGTGEVLRHCLQDGYKELVVAVGGSASTDGGTGALWSLGARFLDVGGHDLPLGGGSLVNLHKCSLDALKKWTHKARLRVATDVTNPLLGKNGAAAVFAPQKGASKADVELLEKGLKRLADVLEPTCGKHARDLSGAGAAGGTAFGLVCAMNAEIVPGFPWLAELFHVRDKIAASDLVITAEGCLDQQSLQGKVLGGLAQMCSELKRPLFAVPATMDPKFDLTAAKIKMAQPAAVKGIAGYDDIVRATSALLQRALSATSC
jgi:glycerate 2-kinase